MNDSLIPRAELLIQQNRHEEAGKILADAWANEPDDIYVLALYAEVKLSLGQLKEAHDLINNAISLSPETDYLYYIKARIALQKESYDEAEKNLKQAISINPEDANHYALWASIKLARKDYSEALNLADTALELDPENLFALNTRSTSLLKLNRKEESHHTIQGALNEDPDNAYTHANYGWNLLEQGDHKQALKHFREALRNDPNFEYAQQGMGEALKARYTLYRWFLQYSFWMGNLTSKYQWAVIIGFFFGTKLLRGLGNANENLKPFIQPLVALLMIVAFSTWVMTPISNLFLRLNTYGKHLLSDKEKMSSNFVAVSMSVFISGIFAYFIGGERWLPLSVFGFAMMVPLSVMFAPAKYKYLLIIYAAIMFCIGTAAVLTSVVSGEIFNGYSGIFFIGFIAFQWLANFILIRENNV